MSSSDSSSKSLTGLSYFAIGAGIGTAAMFFSDPVSGRRRRAYVRDQGIHLQKTSVWYARKQLRNIANHMQGLIAEVNSLLNPESPPSDQKLESRVRSELGRLVEHPSAMHVVARAGVITLDGKVLGNEITRVYAKARAVRGVKRVINRLETASFEEQAPTQRPVANQTAGISSEAMLH